MLTSGESGKMIQLPNKLRVIRQHNYIYIYKSNNIQKEFSYFIEPEKKTYINELKGYILLTKEKNIVKREKILYTIAFNCDIIKEKIYLRSRQAGDKIYIAGIGGNKSIKKLFIDLKIPSLERDSIPLLAINNDILWIKDFKTSDYYKADSKTRNILYFYLLED